MMHLPASLFIKTMIPLPARLFQQSPLNEGKTKRIIEDPTDPTMVFLIAKDAITAGDGEMHDVIPNKGRLANETTCNVFRLLKACGIPVAFDDMLDSSSWCGFRAPKCAMLLFEVVARREAFGSYLDRNPHLAQGHLFRRIVVEIFLKTSGKVWKGVKTGTTYELQKDDPLMAIDYDRKEVNLFYPGHTSQERKTAHRGALVGQTPFLTLPFDEVFLQPEEARVLVHEARVLVHKMDSLTRQTFMILEKAWQLQNRKLVDFKVEFGIDANGQLLLADVIDNDSWRLISDGKHLDKQVYRDGGNLNEVAANYQLVTELTRQFSLPKQRLVLWTGSPKDDLSPFHEALKRVSYGGEVQEVVCSAHKQPTVAVELLEQLLWEVPDTVVIAYIGMSNGAGPILSAHATAPVITVPQGWEKFPDDVWSSLRAPSNIPVMTMLNPANAVQAALQILAMRHPGVYAALRISQEERMTTRF